MRPPKSRCGRSAGGHASDVPLKRSSASCRRDIGAKRASPRPAPASVPDQPPADFRKMLVRVDDRRMRIVLASKDDGGMKTEVSDRSEARARQYARTACLLSPFAGKSRLVVSSRRAGNPLSPVRTAGGRSTFRSGCVTACQIQFKFSTCRRIAVSASSLSVSAGAGAGEF